MEEKNLKYKKEIKFMENNLKYKKERKVWQRI